MRRLGPLVIAVIAASCISTRQVSRGDWPTLAQDRAITVATLDGKTHKFSTFTFTTGGLSGRTELAPGASDSVLVPLDSISVVRVRQVNTQATLLLLAAAATAVFIVRAEGESTIRPTPVPRPSMSCPFIYSFDGRQYVFDSETYSGAIARGLERADVDNLDHLRAVRGKYRVRLTNERPETHYTDQLALLVADHAAGTRAIPDVDGTVHLVRGARPSGRITSFAGDTMPSRAGWEVTFARPAGDTLALVLRTKNTPLAPFVLERVLSLLGTDVYQWYASLRSSLMTRAVMRGWLDREGALDVQLDRGRGWASVARIPDVGPAIAKSNVVMLDLRGITGDSVRVRLESSPNLWVLESAELGSYAGRAEFRTVLPSRATDERGVDVRAELTSRDSVYLVTAVGSDVAIEFEAPAPAPGMERTVLAKTTGHYYAHTNDTGVPNRQLVTRLMSDRRFLQEYVGTEWERAGGAPLPVRARGSGPR